MGNGPFGFECGQKIESFTCGLEEVAPHKFILSEPPKPHYAFDMYVGMITPNYGLSWLKAVGKTISTNPYGIEVKTNFERMKEKLDNVYGKSEISDFLMQDSIWNEPRDWMQALQSGERILMAVWSADNGSKMKDSLVSVALLANATDTETGYIAVEYEFKNHVAAEKEISDMEDDAL